MKPISMTEEYSKELLISEASSLMDSIMMSWSDLVIDDISQTYIRASGYKDGKVNEGKIGWHICVGSALAGIGRQVSIEMEIKNGQLIRPKVGTTNQGDEISLEPNAFSNWCRLGISSV